jgi:hypothetical protein
MMCLLTFYNPVSCLISSAVSAGNDWTAFYTPVIVSSVGSVVGEIAKFRPFCRALCKPSSNGLLLKLTAVSLWQRSSGWWILWMRRNFWHCLVLFISPINAALSEYRQSVSFHSNLESVQASWRLITKRSLNVAYCFSLLWWISSLRSVNVVCL